MSSYVDTLKAKETVIRRRTTDSAIERVVTTPNFTALTVLKHQLFLLSEMANKGIPFSKHQTALFKLVLEKLPEYEDLAKNEKSKKSPYKPKKSNLSLISHINGTK